MKRVAIIGTGSYLAAEVPQYFEQQGIEVITIDWRRWRERLCDIKSAGYVINFAISPEFSRRSMDINEIIDIQIAKELKSVNTVLIFLSSRKVYGRNSECIVYSENSELRPFDAYSENKVKVEKELQRILPDRLAILRISNIVGSLKHNPSSTTFMGWIRDSYINRGYLMVDQNPDAIKDFITVSFFHEVLLNFVKKNITGVYNVSSNVKITVREILSLCVNGNLLVNGTEPVHEQFLLNNEKLFHATGLRIDKDQILDQAKSNYTILCALKSEANRN